MGTLSEDMTLNDSPSQKKEYEAIFFKKPTVPKMFSEPHLRLPGFQHGREVCSAGVEEGPRPEKPSFGATEEGLDCPASTA